MCTLRPQFRRPWPENNGLKGNMAPPNASTHQTSRIIMVYVLVTQSCLILCDPMDCSLPGSSVCGILQARMLE